MGMKFTEGDDPRFSGHKESVKAFNAEAEALMQKYGIKGIILGVTSGEKTEDGVACAAFANGYIKDSTPEIRRALVEIIERCEEDIFEKIKFRVGVDSLAQKLGIDPEKLAKENCDCEKCTAERANEESDKDRYDDSDPKPKKEEHEEDPASQVARENCEAIPKDDRE